MAITRKTARTPKPKKSTARARGRSAKIRRKTKETAIEVDLNLDGRGTYQIATGVPFLDHMLELFARHGFFDLAVKGSGDLEIDDHHTVEDVGLTLGGALREALGDKAGIRRFGSAIVPLDEALVQVVVDLSGRPFLAYDVTIGQERVGGFDVELVHDFLLAFSNQVGMNLHVRMVSGRKRPPHRGSDVQGDGPGSFRRGCARPAGPGSALDEGGSLR